MRQAPGFELGSKLVEGLDVSDDPDKRIAHRLTVSPPLALGAMAASRSIARR